MLVLHSSFLLYGRPYVIPALRQTAAEEAEDSLAEYMRQTLMKKLKNAQIVPPLLSVSISEAERDLKPGDQVLRCFGGRSGQNHVGKGHLPF